MFRVVGCLSGDHDPRLISIACVVCVLAASTSVRLLTAGPGEQQRLGRLWTAMAVLAFSTGAWTTHFIGILAYRPDVPIGLDPGLGVLSFALATVATAIAYLIRPREAADTIRTVASGLVLAGGIGAMHFVGMRSVLLPGVIHYDPDLVVASLCLGALCTIVAMRLLLTRPAACAVIFLTLGVASLHFVAMGSVTLELAGGTGSVTAGVSRAALTLATVGAGAVLLALALIASIVEQEFSGRLALDAQRFRALADATFEGLIFERDGRIFESNRSMAALAGTDAKGLAGLPVTELIPGIDFRRAERGAPVEYDMRLPGKQTLPVEVLWRSGPDRGERIIAVRDISREIEAGRVARVMRYDPLTGLANREMFEQQLHRTVTLSDRTGDGVAVLYVDIDRFVTIIETLGHIAAEQILIKTARRLGAAVRDTDTVARIARDEFAILCVLKERVGDLPSTTDRILAELSQPLTIDDQPIVVTVSAGLALYPADGTRGQDLLRNAMLATRQAKNDGRGRWRRFEPGMDLLLRTKRSMEQDLRIALRDNQFVLNYQPFLDTAALEIVGYEALLRWDHPDRGRVPPADFIPLAEECGLIVPIGSWVLATACAEAASWDRPLIVSVNLSPSQFVQTGIVGTVAEVLRRSGLTPDRLELEITEGTLMADTHNALRILTELKALGLKIAMDDFGTGYSSLSYLRKFPFDKIKIDRSFISDVEDDPEAATIVQAIIAMSRGLRLDVTAEGVETKQQLETLRALGCTFVQGYLLGLPCAVSQLGLHAVGAEPARAPAPRVAAQVGND